MRRLKGITINGEWLGDNVEINSMFRAICSISEIVMLEFIKVINKINSLEQAVSINNFSFPDNNTIRIAFSNNTIKGCATLYFCLKDGKPCLIDSNVILNPPIEKKNNIENSLEIIQDNDISIAAVTAAEEENIEASEIEELPVLSQAETHIEEISVEDEIETEEEEKFEQEESIETNVEEEEEIHDSRIETANIEYPEPEISKDTISAMVDDLISRAPDLSALTQPIQIQVIQPQVQPDTIQQNEKTDSTQALEDKEELINEPEITDDINKNAKELKENEITALETNVEQSIEADFIDDYEEENSNNDNEIIDGNIEIEINAEHNEDSNIENCTSELSDMADDDEFALSAAAEEDNDIVESTESEVKEYPIDENENIEAYLSDFYETNVNQDEEIVLDKATKDNIAMQAMLSEVLVLREELSKLKAEKEQKEESPKIDINNFLGENSKILYNVEDDDADFKIMADGTRINASILDEDLFIAGDKLYRWGGTLYLDR